MVAPVGADAPCDEAVELPSDPAAVRRAEREHEPDDRHREPEPERPHGDERAPGHDQRAERDQDERRDVGRPADDAPRARARAAAQAEPEHAGEEDPDRDQAEPDQLGVVVAPGALPAPLHARRRPRPRLGGTRLAASLRHRRATSRRTPRLLPGAPGPRAGPTGLWCGVAVRRVWRGGP